MCLTCIHFIEIGNPGKGQSFQEYFNAYDNHMPYFTKNEGREEKKTVSFWLDPQAHKPSGKAGGDLRVNSKLFVVILNSDYHTVTA